MSELLAELSRLKDLIEYVRATEREKLRTVADVSAHQLFRWNSQDFESLPGVSLNVASDDDPIWLSIERLVKQSPPPVSDPELALWCTVRDDPTARPALSSEANWRDLRAAGLVEEAEQSPAHVKLEDYAGAERLAEKFRTYIATEWAPWAAVEGERRTTIRLYNELFALRAALEGAAETPLELLWGLGVATWSRNGERLRYPLLTVPVEVSLDDETTRLEIRPRLEAQPNIEADPLDKVGAEAVDDWRRASRKIVADQEGFVSPFEPSSYQPVLQLAAARLDADARYLPSIDGADARSIPPITDHLQVSDATVLFARERRATPLMQDLERFLDALREHGEAPLPSAVEAMVTVPAEAPSPDDYPTFRGVSTIPGATSSDGGGADLFFPKPFNREQVEVVQRLEMRPGVVVQGPPGTGKTHTIANIVSHYLALGKRVLVTSMKEPALKVLRDQLPEAVRPLAVSLLASDREGLKQFQASVEIIAARLQSLNRSTVKAEIEQLDQRIDAIHRELAALDREVETIGQTSIAAIELEGERCPPVRAAHEIVADPERADWLPDDIAARPEHAPVFGDADIAAARQARREIGADLPYLGLKLPDANALPDDVTLRNYHRDLSRVEVLRDRIEAGELPRLGIDDDEAEPQLSALLDDIRRLEEQRRELAATGFTWTAKVARTLRLRPDEAALTATDELGREIEAAFETSRAYITKPVHLPEGALDDDKLAEAITREARGERGFGLLGGLFGKDSKARLEAITVAALRPAGPADWAHVEAFRTLLLTVRRLVAGWNSAAALSGLDPVEQTGIAVLRAMKDQLEHLAALRETVSLERDCDRRIAGLLPSWRGTVADDAATTAAVAAALDTHLARLRLGRAEAWRAELVAIGAAGQGAISRRLSAFATTILGDPEVEDEQLLEEWRALRTELDRLIGLAPHLATVDATAAAVAQSGAPLWAERLRTEPVEGEEDPWTPGDWRERWRLRRLKSRLAEIDRHDRLKELGKQRREAEEQLKRAYARAIEQRTWLRLAEQASDRVKSSLAAYAQAVRRIGKGTGKTAAQFRRQAREASLGAKDALPCWIMPHYRVSESLPSQLGIFDLVIVDEASQSTLAALPALLRAKKVLIVGDDKQVSPDQVGVNTTRAAELAKRHLAEQVPEYRPAFGQERSLYDLGNIVFAGGAVMLKEHFRCVAPIIEYSKREFYADQLLPLRLPTASERLDPPLIDILVEDGYRRRDNNPPEIDCIVEEIKRITEDPAMATRTIGVVTLLGQKQAPAIYARLQDALDPSVLERHAIRCGDPTAFQGDERDIMFVSMVATKGDAALVREAFNQRFNVAASRARDRMVLVRSVELGDLSRADTLRRGLIEHFRMPFPSEGPGTADRRALCESPFEEEMFDLLVARGYRVQPQVRVGNFRIDLVVEGENDRRLAVECDGDQFHGPDQWADDMARQRILERAGWQVWRCFASRFVRDREAVVTELIETLTRRGIEPIGVDPEWKSVHTEHRRWRTSPEEGRGEAQVTASDAADEETAAPEEGLAVVVADAAMPVAEPEPSTGADILERFLRGRSRLTAQEASDVLEGYRTQVIEREFPGAEPGRSILRPEMIKAMIAGRMTNPEEFHTRVPGYLRERTDGRQLRYLEDIVEVLSRCDEHAEARSARVESDPPAAPQSERLFQDEPAISWPPYREATIDVSLPDDFPHCKPEALTAAILSIVRQEGPVHTGEIAKRLPLPAGDHRMAPVVRSKVEQALVKLRFDKKIVGQDGFWQLAEQREVRPRNRRVALATLRQIEAVAPTELREAARIVVAKFPALELEEAVELLIESLGLDNTGQARTKMAAAVTDVRPAFASPRLALTD